MSIYFLTAKTGIPVGGVTLLSETLRERLKLLTKVLAGLSQRSYADTVVEAAKAFGVSAGTISNRVVEITAKKLKEFKERSLSKFKPFAIYLDTIHRGGEAFIVALGISVTGKKRVLGFWQGATENSDICEELMADLERRGLKLSKRIIFITDGGAGIIKWLRDRFGKKLIHVRDPQVPQYPEAPGEEVSQERCRQAHVSP